MRRVAVIGVGVTKFGKHDRISAELFAEAAAQAIRDADIAPSAIEALYYGNVTGGEGERQLHMGPLAATLLGLPTIPTTRFENACATSHAAFRHALMEIASGVSDVVLVGGAERVLNVPTDAATEYFAYCSEATYEQSVGLTFPGVFALIARAHMEKYGTTEEQMAHVAVKNHRHGVLNPKAQFQKEISLEMVLKSAYVADPLKLFDCCPFTDGGAALVLASEEVARKRPRAVWVLGSEAASDTMFRSEEHTSELQSHLNLVCRLLLEKKKKNYISYSLLLVNAVATVYTNYPDIARKPALLDEMLPHVNGIITSAARTLVTPRGSLASL